MTTFQDARAFLLKHRTDYDAAVKGFRWPDPVPFNWALDWFDAELARIADSKDRAALWIVDAASNRETKLSFEALSRRSNQVANFLRAQGLKARRSSAAVARQRRAAVGDHAGGDEARRGGDPRDHAADAGRIARPARSRPRQGGGGVAGPGRQNSSVSAADDLVRMVVGATSKPEGWLPYDEAVNFPDTFTAGWTDPTPKIRCCCISRRAPRRNRNWCGTASAAIPSARCRPCTGWAAAGRRASQYFFAGLGQARLELLVRAVECRRHRVRGQPAALRRQGLARDHRPLRRHHAVRAADGVAAVHPGEAWRLQGSSLREVCGAGEPLNPEVIDQVRPPGA